MPRADEVAGLDRRGSDTVHKDGFWRDSPILMIEDVITMILGC